MVSSVQVYTESFLRVSNFLHGLSFIMVCFSVFLSKHHTKTHTGEYSNGIFLLNFVPAVHGHKMSAVYPGHIISDANCIGGWVGPRTGLDDVEKRLTPTALRKVAVVLLYNPALPKTGFHRTSSGVP